MRTDKVMLRTAVVCLFLNLPVLMSATLAQELPSAKPESVGLSADRLERIGSAVQRDIDENRIDGAVTLVMRHGQVAWFKAQGMSDREAGKPMRQDSLFRICSMTKPITSVAVMMLEDNVVNQKLAIRMLEKMGHQVVLVRNGLEACETMSFGGFDLVLMDLQMPVMGGLEATKRIRESEKATGQHVPIMAMTAHAATQDERNCVDAGMDGYLTKPVRREQLARAIGRVTMKIPAYKSELETASDKEQAALDWNLNEVLDRVDGDREFLRELLVIFREDGRACMQKAEAALANGELAELSRTAHTMKGMLKNLAMSKGANLAAALEVASRSGCKGESEELLAELERAVAAILPEVEAQLSEVKA